MKFIFLEFFSNGFSLVREDKFKLFFHYSAVEHVNLNPHTVSMRLKLKKYGCFTRDYENGDEMERDAKKLLNKGKL